MRDIIFKDTKNLPFILHILKVVNEKPKFYLIVPRKTIFYGNLLVINFDKAL